MLPWRPNPDLRFRADLWGPHSQFYSGALPQLSAVNGGGMEREGSGGSGASAGLLQQILSLKLVPRVGNGTLCPNSTSLCSFPGTGGPAGVGSPSAESWGRQPFRLPSPLRRGPLGRATPIPRWAPSVRGTRPPPELVLLSGVPKHPCFRRELGSALVAASPPRLGHGRRSSSPFGGRGHWATPAPFVRPGLWAFVPRTVRRPGRSEGTRELSNWIHGQPVMGGTIYLQATGFSSPICFVTCSYRAASGWVIVAHFVSNSLQSHGLQLAKLLCP